MKCPHCLASIGLFSKEMNDLGKTKVCPHCGKGAKLGIIHIRFALAFFPVAILSIVFGVGGPLAAGMAGALGAIFGLGLKRA